MFLTVLADKKFVIEDEPHLMLVEMKFIVTHLTCFLENHFFTSELRIATELFIRNHFSMFYTNM
jgi:hypothetical protein